MEIKLYLISVLILLISFTEAQTQINFPGAPSSSFESSDSLESALQGAVEKDQLNRQSIGFYDALLFLALRPSCSAPGGKRGTCGRLRNCPYLIPYVRRINEPGVFQFIKQHICKIDGYIIYLCCPNTQQSLGGGFAPGGGVAPGGGFAPSSPPVASNPPAVVAVPASGGIASVTTTTSAPTAVLAQGNDLAERCGLANIPFIIGGEEFEQGTWPWLAAVGFPTDGGRFALNCGGSLITRRHVITAAHCFINQIPTHVRLGEHNLISNSDGASPVDFRIAARMNPGYNDATKMNDIELLLLDRTVEFTDFILPACLPTPETSQVNFDGESFSIIGWGATREEGGTVPIPRFARTRGVGVGSCANTYARLVAINPRTMMCAMMEGKDTCQGDSGGPLQHVNPTTGRYYVAGITSFGKGCARPGYPGVYTRVDAYLTWVTRSINSLQ